MTKSSIQRNKDSRMVVVDWYYKMPLFFFFLVARLSIFGTNIQFISTCHPQRDGQIEVVNQSLGSL